MFPVTLEGSEIRNKPRILTKHRRNEMKHVPDTFLHPVVDYMTGYLSLPWIEMKS